MENNVFELALLSGDKDSFNKMKLYVTAYLYKKCDSIGEAQEIILDVFQDACEAIIVKGEKAKEIRNLKAYFFKICLNKLADELKEINTKLELELGDDVEEFKFDELSIEISNLILAKIPLLKKECQEVITKLYEIVFETNLLPILKKRDNPILKLMKRLRTYFEIKKNLSNIQSSALTKKCIEKLEKICREDKYLSNLINMSY